MERLFRAKRGAVRALAAGLLLHASCAAPSTENFAQDASPVPVEVDTPIEFEAPFTLSERPLELDMSKQRSMNVTLDAEVVEQDELSLDGTASASAPAVRTPVPDEAIPMPDPESVKQELQSRSVKLLKCSGSLIDNYVVTAAHCWKELYGGGTTLTGSGTPVFDASGSQVGTITDLIVNHAADTAVGALDGGSADEAFTAYLELMPDLEELAEVSSGGELYAAGFPAGQPLQIYQMGTLALKTLEVQYADDPREVNVLNARHYPNGGPSCTPGFSGSLGEVITPTGKILSTGPFVSYGEVREGEFSCSFALPPDPANNTKVTYLG